MIMYVDAAETLLAVLGVVIVVYGPLQAALADFLRQRLFEQRDELFNLAERGEISFGNEIYVAARAKINTSIRYAHRMSLPRTLFLVWRLSSEVSVGQQTDFEQIKDPQVREKVRKILRKCERSVAQMVLYRAPLALLFFAACLPFVAVLAVLKDGGHLTAKFLKKQTLNSMFAPIERSVSKEINAACC